MWKKLFEEEQEELKKKFIEAELKSKSMGFKVLNRLLEEKDVDYMIVSGKRKSFRDVDNKVKKEKTHWIIEKRS